ncbi:MAG: TonB family protein [Fibrobacter sp.]|nr:TonB family protein [Fibrobacter sp.]
MGRVLQNKIAKTAAGILALGVGLLSAVLTACDGDSPKKEELLKKSVAPAAYEEQRKLALAVDSLGAFEGTVIIPPAESVSVHGKAVEGGVPAVVNFLRERKAGFNYIYKKYQAVKPGFEGSISLDVTVDVCGDVYSVTEISSTTGVPEFNGELKNSISRQKFPKTDQGHYTLSFTLVFVKDSSSLGKTVAGSVEIGLEGDSVAQGDAADSFVGGSSETGDSSINLFDSSLSPGGTRLILPSEKHIVVRGSVAGGVGAVRQFLAKNGEGLLHCYQKMLPRKEDAAGTITLDVTVDPGGSVSGVYVVSSNTNFVAMNNEVKNFVARLKFPPSVQGRYTVTVPLRFEKL